MVKYQQIIIFDTLKGENALKNQKEPDNKTQYMPIYMSLGISLGMVFGSVFGNIGVGMCIGVAIGMGVGAYIDYINKKKSQNDSESDDKDE